MSLLLLGVVATQPPPNKSESSSTTGGQQGQQKKQQAQGKQKKQQAQGKQEKPGKTEGKAKPPGGAVDETDAAAEALRRMFERLKAGKGKPTEIPVKGKEWKVKEPAKPEPGTKPGIKPKSGIKPKPQTGPQTGPQTAPTPKDKPDPQGKPGKPDRPKPDPKEDPRAGRDDPEEVARRLREQAAERKHPGAAVEQQAKPRLPRDPGAVRRSPIGRWQPDALVRGTLTLRQRYRRAGGEVKQDTLGLLGVDVGEAERDPFTATLLARGFLDTSSRSGVDGLSGLDHTADKRYSGRIYDAHVDLHRNGLVRLLRIGRQTLYETPEPLMLDGLSAESEALGRYRLVLGAHAGVPAHLFESSPSGDLAAGMHLGARLWQGGRVRFDYMHIDDRRLLTDADNDLLSISAWQRFGDHTSMHGHYSRLEDRDRDVRVRAHTTIPQWDLDLRVYYDELLETQAGLAAEFDPFSQALLEYHPYRQLGASLTQRLGEDVAWDLGVTLRRLSRRHDEGQFNRDFDRGFLAVHLDDLLVKGASLSLNFDAYATDGNDTAALGLDYLAPVGEGVEVSFGTLYSQYKYDFVTQRERDRVRTWFGGLRYRLDAQLQMSLDYSYETGPFPDSHSAEVRLRWHF